VTRDKFACRQPGDAGQRPFLDHETQSERLPAFFRSGRILQFGIRDVIPDIDNEFISAKLSTSFELSLAARECQRLSAPAQAAGELELEAEV
jgi:hypothetical protein